MGCSESIKMVCDRIEELEPENAIMIAGYLLLLMQAQQIHNLAQSSEKFFQEVVSKAKEEVWRVLAVLKLSVSSPVSPRNSQFAPFSTISNKPETLQAPSWYWSPEFAAKNHNTNFSPISYQEPTPELPYQSQFQSLEDGVDPVNLGNAGFLHGFGTRAGHGRVRRSMFPVKICNYFNKGLCKYGSNCRFFHGQGSERFHPMLDGVDEDRISPGSASLENLELEIVELLKSRSGQPISIASLPMIYFKRYGKVLQAEGYLTESQRHGKVGYTLTNLLARMKNSIHLIDRPHGQYAVILAEDAHKHMETWCYRNDLGPTDNGSRKIYLTFPAESTFTEDDVGSYFSIFGPVEDVRLPCVKRRMFGFVTFESADTAKMILARGNPHYISGAQVLVKPYRDKTKLMDRKYNEKLEPMTQYSSHYLDFEDELGSLPRGYETSTLLRNRLMEERELALDIERNHLERMQIARNQMADESQNKYSMDGLREAEDFDSSYAEHFRYLLDTLSIDSASEEKV